MNKPDNNGLYGDPGIVMPGPDNYRITDPVLLKSLDVFRLTDNSPAKGKGLRIPDNGGRNYHGDPLADVPNIGIE